MKKVCGAIVAAFLLFTFPPFVWAGEGTHSRSHEKNSYYYTVKERIHQMMVQRQFKSLQKSYAKSDPEVKQLFLTYLGASIPSTDEQIQALRQEYEGRIAELNGTISAMQQQFEDVTSQMMAACDVSLAQTQAACLAATQQQLDEMNAAHQDDIVTLTSQLNTACDQLLEVAYQECQSSEPCQETGPPQTMNAWNTGSFYPYAIDRDASGIIFMLDRNNLSIAKLDPVSGQIAQFNPDSLDRPVDIAVDSQSNIYVLDQQASAPLQKFSPDGTHVITFSAGPSIISPLGLFIDKDDRIYVTDRGGAYGGRILVFDLSGNLLKSFGEVSELQYLDYNDIVVDEARQIIYTVTAGFSNMVAKFNINGDYLGAWQGDFRAANGIAVAVNGDIFIADTFNNQIDLYDSNGGIRFNIADDLYRPYHIITDSTGRLYVADHANHQIKVYQ